MKLKLENRAIAGLKFEGAKQYTVPLDTPKGTHLENLQLMLNPKSQSKYFIIRYFIKGVQKRYTIGKFITGPNNNVVFGIKEASEKLFQIFKDCTNSKGNWIKTPNDDEQIKIESKLDEKANIQTKEATIAEIIEEYVCNGFEKVKRKEDKFSCLVPKGARNVSKYLIGYNKRFTKISFRYSIDNELEIFFKKQGTEGVLVNALNKPEVRNQFQKLFKQYDKGNPKYFIKGSKINNSLYDSDFSCRRLCSITPPILNDYLKDFSYGDQKHMINILNILYKFAKSKNLLGDNPPANPTSNYIISKSQIVVDKAYEKAFSPLENKLILKLIEEAQILFPYEALGLKLAFFTGIREEELLRIKKADVIMNEDEQDRIILKRSKINLEQTYPITKLVKTILKEIEAVSKLPHLEWTAFSPWLFPTTRFKSFPQTTDINSIKTRAASFTKCWYWIAQRIKQEIPGFNKSRRNFRKNNATLGQEAGLSNEQIMKLTRHQQKSTLEKFYIDNNIIPLNRKLAEKVEQQILSKK